MQINTGCAGAAGPPTGATIPACGFSVAKATRTDRKLLVTVNCYKPRKNQC